MPHRCCVPFCKGNYDDGPKVSCFNFPKDPQEQDKWIRAIKRENFKTSKASRPKIKQLEKCKHPNSRKTKALSKQLKKQTLKEKAKLSTNIKQNLLGEKILWFRDQLNPEWVTCTAKNIEDLVTKYLNRFNEELAQIKLKHSIGKRKNRQHASRQDIVNMTVKREKEEFETCGIELPDMLNPTQLELLKNWSGELRFIQNFTLKRFSIKNLREIKKVEQKNVNKGQEIIEKVKKSEMDVDT